MYDIELTFEEAGIDTGTGHRFGAFSGRFTADTGGDIDSITLAETDLDGRRRSHDLVEGSWLYAKLRDTLAETYAVRIDDALAELADSQPARRGVLQFRGADSAGRRL